MSARWSFKTRKRDYYVKFSSVAVMSFLSMLTILSSTVSADDHEKWFLMSRHGECADIGVLQRKIPDLGEIEDPQAFIQFMNEKGHEVIVEDVYASEREELKGVAFDVRVPAEELSLMFVKSILCKEILNRR